MTTDATGSLRGYFFRETGIVVLEVAYLEKVCPFPFHTTCINASEAVQ